MRARALAGLCATALAAGCAGTPDGPGGGEHPGFDASDLRQPQPRREPASATGNEHYEALGQRYRVLASNHGYREIGIASWYGRKFHGRRTSSGERFDMYKLTAAHRSLPLPSYVKVTNLDNGRETVVRVNDRGPFKSGRIIDLSYAAAAKLGMADDGTAPVVVEAVGPEQKAPGGQPLAPPTHGAGNKSAAATKHAPDGGRTRAERATDRGARTSAATGTGQASPSAATRPSRGGGRDKGRGHDTGDASARDPGERDERIYLQVGAFAERDNAAAARRWLRGADIRPVALIDGERVYRVRVGPLYDADRAATVSRQVSALGLGTPRVFIEPADEPADTHPADTACGAGCAGE